MIGESTPRGRSATDAATWSWFAAVVAMLDEYPAVQLFNYIDTNWITDEGGRWPGWGDARIEVPGAGYVGSRWTGELGKSRWFNRAKSLRGAVATGRCGRKVKGLPACEPLGRAPLFLTRSTRK